MDQAVPYIQEYCKTYLRQETKQNIDFQKLFDEIDEDGNGTLERDELFEFLKKTTEPDMAARFG